MPVNKPCFAVGYREAPVPFGSARADMLGELLPELICGGLTELYRKLYDEALVNPEFSGETVSVPGACAVVFTGEASTRAWWQTCCGPKLPACAGTALTPSFSPLVKNQMYGEMLADVEGVEDAAEAMAAAFLHGYTLAEEVEALAALTVSDANAALQTMLQEDQAAYVEIEPQAAGEEELE